MEDKFDDANVQRDMGEGWVVVVEGVVAEGVVVVDGGIVVDSGMGEDGDEWSGGCVVGLVSKIWVRSTGLVHASSK